MIQPANLRSLLAAYADVLNRKSAAGAQTRTETTPAAHVCTSGNVLTFSKPLGIRSE